MKRPISQTSLRVRPLTEGRSAFKLQGKVVLVDAVDPVFGAAMAQRYAHEGADLAIAYHLPSEELYALQKRVEKQGARCVLYEIDLDDEWNCGLVVQSTTECLGPIDLVINRRGHVHAFGTASPLTPLDLLDAVHGPSQHYGVAHSAA